MPEHPKKRRPGLNSELHTILSVARKALARGDGWDIEPHHYDRLRKECEELGIPGNSQSITIALRQAFSEITESDLRRRHDTSYSGSEPGQTLYDCRWQSESRARIMYVKFAINGERVEVFTFHEHREG